MEQSQVEQFIRCLFVRVHIGTTPVMGDKHTLVARASNLASLSARAKRKLFSAAARYGLAVRLQWLFQLGTLGCQEA